MVWLSWPGTRCPTSSATCTALSPPEQQHQSLGSRAALCGAMWPGWKLEDTYLMWASADCIVSMGPGNSVSRNFRDTKCFQRWPTPSQPASLQPVQLCLWPQAKGKLEKFNWSVYSIIIMFQQMQARRLQQFWAQGQMLLHLNICTFLMINFTALASILGEKCCLTSMFDVFSFQKNNTNVYFSTEPLQIKLISCTCDGSR